MNSIAGHVWGKEDDDFLIRLVKGGDHTMADIAELFARNGVPVSRNAVIGRVTRLRAKGSLPEARLSRTQRRDERIRKAREEKVEAPPPPPPPPEPAPEPLPSPPPPVAPVSGQALGLYDPWPLRACRYPAFGKVIERDAPVFCGAQTESLNSPYCEAHFRLVYRPREKRETKPAPRNVKASGISITKRRFFHE